MHMLLGVEAKRRLREPRRPTHWHGLPPLVEPHDELLLEASRASLAVSSEVMSAFNPTIVASLVATVSVIEVLSAISWSLAASVIVTLPLSS